APPVLAFLCAGSVTDLRSGTTFLKGLLSVPFNEQLLSNAEETVGKHVDSETGWEEQHEHREHARHEIHHHLLLSRIAALHRHELLLQEEHATDDEGKGVIGVRLR